MKALYGSLYENLPAVLDMCDVVFGCERRGATKFSDCSEKNFESLIQRGGGACLRNPPSQDNIISVTRCGNGILESGEECDCGTPQVCFKIQEIFIFCLTVHSQSLSLNRSISFKLI